MKLGPLDTFAELARATLIDAHSAGDRDRNRGLRTQSVRCSLGVAPIDVPATPAIPPWSRHGNVAEIKGGYFACPRLCANGISAVRGKWLSHHAASSAVFFSVFATLAAR